MRVWKCEDAVEEQQRGQEVLFYHMVLAIVESKSSPVVELVHLE